MNLLVPEDFIVPQRLETPEFLLRPLMIGDVVKDYDAVMSSVEHLQGVFGPNSTWPRPDLSFEQDLIDLAWHHKEFQLRTSFTYSVLSPDGVQVLGCVYVMPPTRDDRDADVYHWVRTSERAGGLDEHLAQRLAQWLAEAWPFERVAYPGRVDPHTA